MKKCRVCSQEAKWLLRSDERDRRYCSLECLAEEVNGVLKTPSNSLFDARFYKDKVVE